MENFSTNRVPGAAEFFRRAVRRLLAAGVAGTLTLTLAACGGTQQTAATDSAAADEQVVATDDSSAEAAGEASDEGAESSDATTDGSSGSGDVDIASFTIDPTDLFSKRDLDPSYSKSEATTVTLSDEGSTASGKGVEVDGSTVTITQEGTYVVSGTLSDGRLVVDVDDSQKVQLVLDGASISSSTGTALYVRNADKVFLTLATGSQNSLASTGASTQEDDHNLDGVVFSCDDLTINGDGALEVTSAAGHGIVGKDELTLVSGDITVTAAGSAIQGKDSVAVKGGTYTLTATTDGIHAQHDTNGAKGFVYIAGGTFNIAAGSDGIDASNDILIDGGTLNIAAADDGIHSEYDLVINDGTIYVAESYESLEGSTVTINGGDIDVTASDDGINAVGVPTTSSTDDTPNGEADSGDQPGQAAPADMPEGEMPQMPEGGFDGNSDGNMGQGPGGGRGGMGGGPRGGMDGNGDAAGNQFMCGGGFDNDPTALVTITGGVVRVSAGGDGIDSNGDLVVTGGETYVNGPTSDGDGPLDYGGEATISGGTLIAVGSSGMAEGFGSNSTQGSALVSAQGNEGDLIELKDAQGNVLASFTTGKSYACVAISAPGMEQGGTYTLSYGSESTEFTLDAITYSNVTGGFGGMGGPHGM